MENKKQLLLVEDDESMGFLLKDSLENYGFNVVHFSNGKIALAEFSNYKFHLCILDVMMPELDGFSLAEKIRENDYDIPLLFLTARAQKEDRIKGLKLGADDYVTKPFSVEELALRIKAILKRGKTIPTSKKSISFASFSLDQNNLILTTASKKVQLTQKESDILALFAMNPSLLLKREYILKSIWKDDSYFVSRSLDVFISKLRKHLKEDTSVRIVNIHGSGYKFMA